MYSREINGEEFTFGVSGKLIMNVLVMYDRQTQTLWSQLLGEAVEGELTGTKLEFLPSILTTYKDWVGMHPDTLVLDKGFSRGTDPYAGYYGSAQTGVIGETTRDDRLYVKEFVVGVEADNGAVAFPYSVLNDEPVVNYTIGDQDIVVFFNTDTGSGVVYNRRVGGEVLNFFQIDNSSMQDDQTGTLWDALSGEAIEGELAGMILEPVKSTSSFWFGWKDFFPDTEVYGVDDT